MRVVNEDLALARRTFEVLVESIYAREGLREPKPVSPFQTYKKPLLMGLGLTVCFAALKLRKRV